MKHTKFITHTLALSRFLDAAYKENTRPTFKVCLNSDGCRLIADCCSDYIELSEVEIGECNIVTINYMDIIHFLQYIKKISERPICLEMSSYNLSIIDLIIS